MGEVQADPPTVIVALSEKSLPAMTIVCPAREPASGVTPVIEGACAYRKPSSKMDICPSGEVISTSTEPTVALVPVVQVMAVGVMAPGVQTTPCHVHGGTCLKSDSNQSDIGSTCQISYRRSDGCQSDKGVVGKSTGKEVGVLIVSVGDKNIDRPCKSGSWSITGDLCGRDNSYRSTRVGTHQYSGRCCKSGSVDSDRCTSGKEPCAGVGEEMDVTVGAEL